MRREKEEQRQRIREIKEFNEGLKSNPALLADDLYLFNNINRCTLKLNQFPPQHLNNLLLINSFFRSPRDSINYKHIKPDILNNRLFLSEAIPSNPDLYFYISNDNKVKFKNLAISSTREYLKYLSNSDYDDTNVLKNIGRNFSSFNESLGCLSFENFAKILKGDLGKEVSKALLHMDLEKCQNFKSTLNLYLDSIKENQYLFKELLNKNPYFCTVLDYKKHQDIKEMVLSIAGKNHDIFKYLPQSWTQDLKVIVQVMTNESKTNYNYQYYGSNYHANVKDSALILKHLPTPDDFIKEELNATTMSYVRKAYPKLSLEWRQRDELIQGLFKQRDDFEITLDYCRSIPDTVLAENLVSHLKEFSLRTLSEVGDTLESVISHHYLTQNLPEKPSGKISQIKI